MNIKKLKFEETKSFSKLFLDYIKGNKFFDDRFPLNGKLFDSAELLQERASKFKKRKELVNVIKTSMINIDLNSIQNENLRNLTNHNSLTVVTGQQVGFLSGPLYTIYKAISAVKLSEKLNKNYEDLKFIPVFWIEDNDHDNFEASHISIYNQLYELIHINCCPDCIKTDRTIVAEKYFDENINIIIKKIENQLPETEYKSALVTLLKNIYIPGKSWCDAFIEFLNLMLAKTGILFIIASKCREAGLQSELSKKELEHPGMTDLIIREANNKIKSNNYHIQAKSSLINLFYQDGNKREKIEQYSGTEMHGPGAGNQELGIGNQEVGADKLESQSLMVEYAKSAEDYIIIPNQQSPNPESQILTPNSQFPNPESQLPSTNPQKEFKVGEKILTHQELMQIANEQKSSFSPNVMLRPVFQDAILPNAVYIGGPGEIGYCLQIKELYEYFDVPMPAFISRHSATFLDKRAARFFDREKLDCTFFMRDFVEISKELTSEIINKDVENNLKEIERQFHTLYVKLGEIACEVDKTLDGTVKSTEQKSLQSFEHIVKKIISSQKKKNSELFEKYEQTYNLFFPSKTMQERIYSPVNIINYIGKDAFIDILLEIFENDYNEHFVISL